MVLKAFPRPLAAAATRAARAAAAGQTVSSGALGSLRVAHAGPPALAPGVSSLPSPPASARARLPLAASPPRPLSTTCANRSEEETASGGAASRSEDPEASGAGDDEVVTAEEAKDEEAGDRQDRAPALSQNVRGLSETGLMLIRRMEALAKQTGDGRAFETTIPLQSVSRNLLRRSQPVPPMRPPVTSHEHFLKLLGRGYEEYARKFTSWEHLFKSSPADMRQMEIPAVPRKWIIKFVELYRRGVDPYHIPPYDRKAAKEEKRQRKRQLKTEYRRRHRSEVKPTIFQSLIVNRVIDI